MTLPPISPDASPERLAPGGSERRVLVIDDSALIRGAATIALAACEVLLAESGEQGIALAETERPDAILLDVVMPGMDGTAVAERLRANPTTSSVPLVFLTAKDFGDDREQLERLGASGVIAKPFDVAALGGELASLLGWPR